MADAMHELFPWLRLAFILTAVTAPLIFSSCTEFKKNKTSDPLSRQASGSLAEIERRSNSDELTAMEASLEKDAVNPSHSFKF